MRAQPKPHSEQQQRLLSLESRQDAKVCAPSIRIRRGSTRFGLVPLGNTVAQPR